MLTALPLALPPTAAPAPTPTAGEEVATEGGFAAEMAREGDPTPEEEDITAMALAALSCAPPPATLTAAPVEGGAAELAITTTSPAVAPPDPSPPEEGAPSEGPTPPSAEAAVRMQMADEAGDSTDAGEEGKAEAAPKETPRPAPSVPPLLTADTAPAAQSPVPLPAPAAAHSVTHPHADPPPAMARQITEGLSAALADPAAGDQIELVLRPEELGRVRFELRGEGDRLMVTLTADRPETMDLLRRHLPDLLAELEQAGYGGASLDFGQPGHSDRPPPTEAAQAVRAATDLSEPLPPQPGLTGSGGLDLRF